MIRHGPTAWNLAHRIQGQTDIPLSTPGRRSVSRWSVPSEFGEWDWIASPLQRATETARILTSREVSLEPALMEMHWGEWEGRTMIELRQSYTQELVQNQARGLDFQPPGGESPRLVQQRLFLWFSQIHRLNRCVVAVTHKGVIRATFALTMDWNMVADSDIKLNDPVAHLFQLDRNALPHPKRINIPLLTDEAEI